jgi:hypothetical protein
MDKRTFEKRSRYTCEQRLVTTFLEWLKVEERLRLEADGQGERSQPVDKLMKRPYGLRLKDGFKDCGNGG